MAQDPHVYNRDPLTGVMLCDDDLPFNVADFQRSSLISIARGDMPGASNLTAYGERTSVAAESNQAVWPNGVFRLPSAAGVQMSIVSTSANDAAAGTHVRTVRIHYLKADLTEATEVITLNGLTPVLTVATDIRFIQCMHAQSVGTTSVAAGNITASNGGITYSEILAGETRCASSFRMVPAGKKLYIDGAVGSSVSGTAAARTIMRLVASQIYQTNHTAPLVLYPVASIGMQDNGISMTLPPQTGFGEGVVVGFMHTTDKAATIAGTWFGHLEPA